MYTTKGDFIISKIKKTQNYTFLKCRKINFINSGALFFVQKGRKIEINSFLAFFFHSFR